MAVLNFIVSEIFGSAPIFLAIIALIGLLLQKKKINDVLSGVFKTMIGVVVLQQGTNIIISSIAPLSNAFSVLSPATEGANISSMGSEEFMIRYGTIICIAMVCAFIINLLVARFTKWKTVFLTGHMLYWFPFVFVAAGVDAGLTGGKLIVSAIFFTALYMVLMPNLFRPFVKNVTGDDSFTIGHPTAGLSIIAGLIGKWFGNKEKSTEDMNLPASLSFLKEISITSSIVISLVYTIMIIVVSAVGGNAVEVFALASSQKFFTYIITQGLLFGAGLTALLLGVRMMIAEIVPAFTGFQEKLIPNAIPALDVPLLFPYAPNAVLIGFLVSLVTSTLTIIVLISAGIQTYVIAPLTITCFFEVGGAAIIGNSTGGRRGAILGAAICGVVMVLLVNFSMPFLKTTIADWNLIFGGNDFSLWSILSGFLSKLIA